MSRKLQWLILAVAVLVLLALSLTGPGRTTVQGAGEWGKAVAGVETKDDGGRSAAAFAYKVSQLRQNDPAAYHRYQAALRTEIMQMRASKPPYVGIERDSQKLLDEAQRDGPDSRNCDKPVVGQRGSAQLLAGRRSR